MTISRRTVLRGASGLALTLPWLESLQPRLARAQQEAPPKRLLVWTQPNGTVMDRWAPTGLKMSPALGLYAAYGVSDVFDVRLEVTARGYHLASEQDPNQLSAMLGLVYKLDVLRWVPWGGVYVGYQGFDAVPRKDLVFEQHDAALGMGLGLDYAFSRSFGAGITLRFDDALTSDQAAFDALLRAEYRWGW